MCRWHLRHISCLVVLLTFNVYLGLCGESVYLSSRQSHSIFRSNEWRIEENDHKLLVVFKVVADEFDGDIQSTIILRDGNPIINLTASLDEQENKFKVVLSQLGDIVSVIESDIDLGRVNQFSIEIDNLNRELVCKISNSTDKIGSLSETLDWANTDVQVILGSDQHNGIVGCVSLIALQIGEGVFSSQITNEKNHMVRECGHDQSCDRRYCGAGHCVQKAIAVCDCYQTGKSGTSCEHDGTSIELNNAGEGHEDNIFYKHDGEPLTRFAMQFKLKGTHEGVLAYAELAEKENMKICVVGKLGTVTISPKVTIKFDLKPDQLFHKLELRIENANLDDNLILTVDGVEQRIGLPYKLLIRSVSFGAGPAEEGVSDAGFTGCFRELYVNEFDITYLAHSNHSSIILSNPATQCSNKGPATDSVVTDAVKLIPPEDASNTVSVLMSDESDEDDIASSSGREPLVLQCENMQKTYCRNEADCLIIEDKPTCICQNGYAGSECQFVLHPRSCAEAKTFFHQRDGPTIIDVDGSSNFRYAVTSCKDGNTYVQNSFPTGTVIRGNTEESWLFRVSYLDFLEIPKLTKLIARSGTCQQKFSYECDRAPLNFWKGQTYFRVATNNQTVVHLDGEGGTCECRGNNSYCRCDARGVAVDHGVLKGTNAGITEIVALNIVGSHMGSFALGPLNCSGFPGENDSFQFTKMSQMSFKEIRDITTLSVQFKTSENSGIILSIGQTVLELLDAYTIRVIQGETNVVLGSQTKLNNSVWHLLRMEWLRDDFLVSVDSNYVVSREIKKLPDHLIINSLERGFHGCVRSVLVNDELLELKKFAFYNKLEYKECGELCSGIKCRNEAECIEDYQTDSAMCRCAFPDIQSGTSCEIDINHRSSVSLHGGYLTYENITNPLVQNTVFSFRTDQSNALLFYAHDHLRNFIQVHLREEVNLTLTLNRDREIHSCTLSALDGDEFSHMQWIQIAIKHIDDEYTQLLVKDEACIIRVPLKLSTSLITQYNNWNSNDGVEIPVGLNPSAVADPTLKVFVGGLTDVESGEEVVHKLRPSYRTKLPNLLGCIRGLKIGNQSINMRDRLFGISPEDPSLVRIGCEVGCDTLTCNNGGHCSIGWRNYDPSASKTKCDCTRTSYIGESCTDDNGMLLSNQIVEFNIKNFMARFVDPPLRGQSLKFAFSPAAARVHTRQVIAILQVDERLFEIILNKNSSLNVAIHDSKKIQVLTFNGNFTDGYRHFFVARFGPNIATSVMVDSSRQSFAHETSSFLDLRSSSLLIIGGRARFLADYSAAGLKKNFQGCLSNLELNVGEGTKSLEFHLMDRLEEAETSSIIERGKCSSFRIPNQPPVLQSTLSLPIFHTSAIREVLKDMEAADGNGFPFSVIIVPCVILLCCIPCVVVIARRCTRKKPSRGCEHSLIEPQWLANEQQNDHNVTVSQFDIPKPEGDLLMKIADSETDSRSNSKHASIRDHKRDAKELTPDRPNYSTRFWSDTESNTFELVPVPTPNCPVEQ